MMKVTQKGNKHIKEKELQDKEESEEEYEEVK
jgi:hypothetical protein